MKRTLPTAILAMVASTALAWGAGESVKSTMKGWKAPAQAVSQMANGATPFDEAKARAALSQFVADSQAIGDRLSPTTPASRDIKLRFARFNAEAAAALALVGSRDEFTISFIKALSECKSCHDQYAH